MLISELATATNETARTLRFYENAGVLPKPPRTRGSYRDYPDTAIARVRFIHSLQ
ncbi:MAG: MerR family transcriptional regulator, partial [Acidimicrobiia bacterium]|nr:MerR family transcriptional regulator [Acidimicrobiia bacterium]